MLLCLAVTTAAVLLVLFRFGPQDTGFAAPSSRETREARGAYADLALAPGEPVEEHAPGATGSSDTPPAVPEKPLESPTGVVAKPDTWTLRGILESETGEYRGRVLLVLEDAESGETVQTSHGRWPRTPGMPQGDFRFEPVKPGNYVLRVDSNDSFDWEPSSQRVHGDEQELVFLCLDRIGRVDVGFRFHDEAGRTLECAWVSARLEKGSGEQVWINLDCTPSGEVCLKDVPRDRPMLWFAGGGAYAPAAGRWHPPPGDGESPNFIDVMLEPGRGRVLRVENFSGSGTMRMWDSRPPLAGAWVLVNGDRVGRTDENGIFLLNCKTPRSLVVEVGEDHSRELDPSLDSKGLMSVVIFRIPGGERR